MSRNNQKYNNGWTLGVDQEMSNRNSRSRGLFGIGSSPWEAQSHDTGSLSKRFYLDYRSADPLPDYEDREQKIETTVSKKSLRKIFNRFADRTAMQGVGYIKSAKLWYSRALWVFLLLVAIGWMAFHLFYLISHFLELPIQTKISLGFNNLQFPAVTICNMNAVKWSRLPDTPLDLQEIAAKTDPGQFNPGADVSGKRKKRFVEGFDDFDFDNMSYYDDYYSDYYYVDDTFRGAERDSVFKIESSFRSLYLSMPRDTRIDVGHQIEDMLLSCSYNGFKCYAENFTLVNTPEYGNCFTIQSKGFVAKKTGPKSGLTLILYMENDEYLRGLSQGYGMRLQIHDQDTFPLPDEEGIFVSSSYETHIGLRLKDITRVTPSYRDCENGQDFKRQHKVEYSRTVCRIVCEQSVMVRECGCYFHEYKEFYHFSNSTFKNKWCRTQSEISCINKIQREFKLQNRNCKCPNPCRENKYSLFPSSRQWPTEKYSNTLLTGLCERFPLQCFTLTSITDPRLLSLNFLKVTIYYEDLNYEKIEEEPEIATAQFASDVGGAIGLWIGLSVLAIFEVVQFFLELCKYGFHVCKHSSGER